MKKRLLILLILLLMTSIFVYGCGSNKKNEGNTAKDTIRIGVFEPLTGANAAAGALEIKGIEVAHELYPEILGKKIELVTVDNKSDRVEAAYAATRLVEKEGVVAIIGSWGSSFSMAAGETVKNAKVPAVGASCTNPLVTKDNEYYFRVCFTDPFQSEVLAKYVYNKLNAKRVAIIKEVSSDYAVGLAKYFRNSFIKLTGNENSIIAEANYNTGDHDFTAQLKNIKLKNPDVIFAPGNFTESALVIKQARKLGITARFIGGDTWEIPDFIKIGKEAVEGSIFSTFFASEKPITEEAKIFLKKYKQMYNREPEADAALAYDAYILIVDAIKRAGEASSVKIREKLATTKDFLGVAGVINFDSDRNAIKEAVMKTIKQGRFTYLDTITPTK